MALLFSPTDQLEDNRHFERSLRANGIENVAGTDEVGRGPLAGPVVAACVILPEQCDTRLFKDSKKLSVKKREAAAHYLSEIEAITGIGICDHELIDSVNILQASLLAMKAAVEQISDKGYEIGHLLVDGKFEVPIAISQTTLVKGESKSVSIAAASILAKITRDRMMKELHERYPEFNFKKNMGYPTKEHREAILKYGPCPYHRKTFRGVKEFVEKKEYNR